MVAEKFQEFKGERSQEKGDQVDQRTRAAAWELPHAMFRPSLPLGFFYPLDWPTNLSRVGTFSGAACLKKFAAMHAPRQITRGLSGTAQSGSPPAGRA